MIAGIIGATGYAGSELIKLLLGHTSIKDLSLASTNHEGTKIEHLYPHFLSFISAPLKHVNEVIEESNVVFSALPAGLSEEYARTCAEKGTTYIDLSADFRFGDDEKTYKAWYGKRYLYPALHNDAVYGLPELNREKIRNAKIIGNPGCYPTGAALGIIPALIQGIAGEGTIIIDSASGVTGAGHTPSAAYHYPQVTDSFSSYKIGSHRHTPEISRVLSLCFDKDIPVIFTPHLAPMNRGILSTIYIPLSKEWRDSPSDTAFRFPPCQIIAEKTRAIRTIYEDFYRKESFIRVLPLGLDAATNRVRGSNFCDISIHISPSSSTLIVVSAIDNMGKGACGQAIQNMNIVFGFDEKAGLKSIPSSF